jgi:ribosomal protein L29
MKTQVKKELQAKTKNELEKLLKEAREELIKLKLDFTQNKLQNTRMLFWKKKEIAVLQTFLKTK